MQFGLVRSGLRITTHAAVLFFCSLCWTYAGAQAVSGSVTRDDVYCLRNHVGSRSSWATFFNRAPGNTESTLSMELSLEGLGIYFHQANDTLRMFSVTPNGLKPVVLPSTDQREDKPFFDWRCRRFVPRFNL